MNLHEKLIEVRKSVDYLKKESTGKQYSYVSSSQVLANLRDALNEHKILLIPTVEHSVVSKKEEQKPDGKTTITYFTELKMTMTWVDATKPEDKIECRWYGQGVDIAGEKGVGKALTYAEKYFMLKFFNIPTDKDDPDSFQKKHEQAKPQPKKEKGNLDEFFTDMQASTSLEDLKIRFADYKNFTWTDDEKKQIIDEKNRIKETL